MYLSTELSELKAGCKSFGFPKQFRSRMCELRAVFQPLSFWDQEFLGCSKLPRLRKVKSFV